MLKRKSRGRRKEDNDHFPAMCAHVCEQSELINCMETVVYWEDGIDCDTCDDGNRGVENWK